MDGQTKSKDGACHLRSGGSHSALWRAADIGDMEISMVQWNGGCSGGCQRLRMRCQAAKVNVGGCG